MAKPGIAEDECVNGYPTGEELEEIRALLAENAQLMKMRNVQRDSFNALLSEVHGRYCEARCMQDGISYLLEEILEHVCGPSKDQECQGAMTHGNDDSVENILPQPLKSASISERFHSRLVSHGAPSWAPDSGKQLYQGADILSPDTPSSASECAWGSIPLQTASQTTISGDLLESWAACTAGVTSQGTTLHRSGTPPSHKHQVSSESVSLLHQPQHTPNLLGPFSPPTQSPTEMPPWPSHTIETAVVGEDQPKPAALQTNEFTMQHPSQLTTRSILTMQDVGLQDAQAHGLQWTQCNLSEHHNQVKHCEPQQRVNVQKEEPDHHLHVSNLVGSSAACSSESVDGTFSVTVDAPKREQPASGRINPGVTTLVVRNVPARYTKEELLQEWPPDGAFDFLYLPFNHRQKRAAGYCFVNFTSHEAALTFCNQWHSKLLSASKRTGKRLSIGAAEVQGLEANLQHLMCCGNQRTKNTKYLPSVFNADREMPFTEHTRSDILLALRANRPLLQSMDACDRPRM